MSEKRMVVLDTNIFVYMFDETDDLKRRRAEQLVGRSIETGTGSATGWYRKL